jgi:hypothetical protein
MLFYKIDVGMKDRYGPMADIRGVDPDSQMR